MENKTDISKILDSKSEEKLIVLARKLLTKELTNEQEKNLLIEIKKQIIELTQNKSIRIKELYKIDDKKIIEIDENELDFALKLIYKDKETYEQIEKLKKKKNKQTRLNGLIELKEYLEQTQIKLSEQLEKINIQKIKESKIPIIKNIKRKIDEKKQNKILGQQLDKIIEIIEQSKHPENIKNLDEFFKLKEEIYKQENIKTTLDILVKKCKIRDTSKLSELRKKLKIEYHNILENIKLELEKNKEESKIVENYDKRLVEYVYNKPKNYITQIIDHTNNNTIFVEIILILKLISQYEKNKIKLTYISPDIKKQTIIKKNKQSRQM